MEEKLKGTKVKKFITTQKNPERLRQILTFPSNDIFTVSKQRLGYPTL